MNTLDKTPFVNTNYVGSRLECVRHLDHLSIYTDPQSGRFILFDNTNVLSVFDDLSQVTMAALKAHTVAIDKKNRQFVKTA